MIEADVSGRSQSATHSRSERPGGEYSGGDRIRGQHLDSSRPIVVGILAVQGAFLEHRIICEQLGCDVREIRQAEHVSGCDAFILPGGESTAQRKLLHDTGIYQPLRDAIAAGTPVVGTCAGMILLAEKIVEGHGSGGAQGEKYQRFVERYPTLGVMPIVVERNAYGRQLGSFVATAQWEGLGETPATFIRAPYVRERGDGVDTLCTVKNKLVAVRYKKMVAVAFHPELDGPAVHEWFLSHVVA